MITKYTTIEEIVSENPKAVTFLSEKGIRCIVCGEPVWGSLEDIAKEKGWDELNINILVDELNAL